MKAIETTYSEVRFRSRLEARFAVFLDCLKVPWRYEFEGFELPSGRYLPDFWLPDVGAGVWIEIKGEVPTDAEQRFASELWVATGKPVVILIGDFEKVCVFADPKDAKDPEFVFRAIGRSWAAHFAGRWPTGHEFDHALNAARKHRFWDPVGMRR